MENVESVMVETNFYTYMFSQAGSVVFDELVESVDLSNPESIQKAFEAYLSDYSPPYEIKEALLEEKFYASNGNGKNSDKTLIRYDIAVPGITEKVDAESLKTYFEDFLEQIGAVNNSENMFEVDVNLTDNERGGIDINIYIAIGGRQTKGRGGL